MAVRPLSSEPNTCVALQSDWWIIPPAVWIPLQAWCHRALLAHSVRLGFVILFSNFFIFYSEMKGAFVTQLGENSTDIFWRNLHWLSVLKEFSCYACISVCFLKPNQASVSEKLYDVGADINLKHIIGFPGFKGALTECLPKLTGLNIIYCVQINIKPFWRQVS